MRIPIDQAVLGRAAEHLLAIKAAGHREQLEREYWARVHELSPIERPSRCRNPMRELSIEYDAKLLSLLCDAPFDQCDAAIREASSYLPEREVGLELLSQMAADVNRMEARKRREGRHTA